jgi:Protein of unknown function, DUF417
MNSLIKILARSGLLKGDLDSHLVRGSMVLMFLLFGYQKWFEYEAQTLIPFISNGPAAASSTSARGPPRRRRRTCPCTAPVRRP